MSRGLCLKFDRTYCLAGQNGHFQIVLSQPPSLFFVQPNDPSLLCDRCMGAFRTHPCIPVLEIKRMGVSRFSTKLKSIRNENLLTNDR